MAENKITLLNSFKRYAMGAIYSEGVPDETAPGDASKIHWNGNPSAWVPESSVVQSIQDFIANDVATQTFTHELIDTKTMVRSNRIDSPIYEVLNLSLKNRETATVNGKTVITSCMTSAEFWTSAIKTMLRNGWVYIKPVYATLDGTYAVDKLTDLVILDERPDDLTDVIALKSPYNQGLQAKKLMNKAFEVLWADMGSDDIKGLLRVNGQIDQKTGKFHDSMDATLKAFYEYVDRYRIGTIDNKTEYKELSNDYRKVKPEDIAMLEDEVYAVFGVNRKVIMGTATPAQMTEYREKVLGPINKQLKDELNRVLLSSYLRTLTSNKKTIEHIGIYENQYLYASPTEKAQIIQQATNAGIATRNELRDILGLPPEENGDELVTNLNNVRIAGGQIKSPSLRDEDEKDQDEDEEQEK